MNNASASKTKHVESPKTPGGISKSLLTPCRRLGLSRNWRKGGSSPFISPLASSSEVKQEKLESKKRKEPDLDDDCTKTPESSIVKDENNDTGITNISNKNTPSRNVDLPRRKKSKSLLSAINNTQVTVGAESPTNSISLSKNASEESKKDLCENIITEKTDVLSTPSKTKDKCTKDITSAKSGHKKQNLKNVEQIPHEEAKAIIVNDSKNVNEKEENDRMNSKKKEHKPNDLKKECIVVIQKKIFKTESTDNNKIINNETMTQTLFDSDSDDVPLNNLSLKRSDLSQNEKDDCETKLFMKKSSEKTSKKSKNISKNLTNPKVISKPKSIDTKTDELSDDDFIEPKKTILIRKTYAKVTKPSKAKSTGSITQRDIDELKARIEVKKKLLLAQAMTEDTRELRDLIKKWQKGCQDALMELMDLMKTKFPDKSNMDYSEILQTLKIPPSLVGYDTDEDCFNTPDDTSIILATLNDT